ncbi:MAG: LuxR C-terminal-related transcriptional regulator [Desulfobacterales bacterium]
MERKRVIRQDQNTLIHIIGSSAIQNELLASFLKKDTGCRFMTGAFKDLDKIIKDDSSHTSLILIDCIGIDGAGIWSRIFTGNKSKVSQNPIVLFNVDPDGGIEREAVSKGIRGIFYLNDPMEIFPRGVLEILKGELWYSRKTMSDFLLKRGSFNKYSERAASALTFREREILIGIASGASNKDLAADFSISLHTVKTHIYNIYKKINVPNRLQAALWAAQYL